MKTQNVNPAVSVVMPCYNAARFLPRSIESVLSQTFTDFELLVIDDCSTDSTADVMAGYLGDARVRYMRHEQNKGPSAARNTGIQAARGELVAFLDSDDYWLPRKLERQVSAFADPVVGASCVAAIRIRPEKRDDRKIKADTEGPSSDIDTLYQKMLFGYRIPGSSSSVMTRRRCFDEVGFFDESITVLEDHDMWTRLASRFRFAYVDEPLVHIVKHSTGNSTDPIRAVEGYSGFLRNRERDIPWWFRYLLPRIRRHCYVQMARLSYRAGRSRDCRRYCLMTISSSSDAGKDLQQAFRMLIRSFIPRRLHLSNLASAAGKRYSKGEA